MSTKYPNVGTDQEAPPRSPGLLQAEKGPPVAPFPKPLQRPPRPMRNRWMVPGAVIVLLALILSVGGIWLAGQVQRPGSQVKPTPTAPAATTSLTPTPGVSPSPQPGPPGVNEPAYWDKIIGTQAGTNNVESVTFAHLMSNSSLQALVTVRYTGTDARLDVYVFTDINNAHPKQIFKLVGLVKGDARLSGYNTVMTAEIDKNSGLNVGKTVSAMKPDLFREFGWSSKEGAMVQVAFPGIYPDLTRYQAEQDQALVNQGKDTWKNDPAQVARNLAVKLLNWSNNAQTTVLSGGGINDVNAVVQVKSAAPDHPAIKVTLSRLEGNTHNLWVAISVTTDGMSITSPQKWATLTNPAQIKGTGGAFEGDVGTVFVLDHLYTDIGRAKGIPANNGKTTFTAPVSYDTSFHGTQEGVLAFYRYSEADGSIAGVVLLKVLISG